jgi:hypothetical protein
MLYRIVPPKTSFRTIDGKLYSSVSQRIVQYGLNIAAAYQKRGHHVQVMPPLLAVSYMRCNPDFRVTDQMRIEEDACVKFLRGQEEMARYRDIKNLAFVRAFMPFNLWQHVQFHPDYERRWRSCKQQPSSEWTNHAPDGSVLIVDLSADAVRDPLSGSPGGEVTTPQHPSGCSSLRSSKDARSTYKPHGGPVDPTVLGAAGVIPPNSHYLPTLALTVYHAGTNVSDAVAFVSDKTFQYAQFEYAWIVYMYSIFDFWLETNVDGIARYKLLFLVILWYVLFTFTYCLAFYIRYKLIFWLYDTLDNFFKTIYGSVCDFVSAVCNPWATAVRYMAGDSMSIMYPIYKPESVLEGVVSRAQDPPKSMVMFAAKDELGRPVHIGCGTLIKRDTGYYVVTALHVVDGFDPSGGPEGFSKLNRGVNLFMYSLGSNMYHFTEFCSALCFMTVEDDTCILQVHQKITNILAVVPAKYRLPTGIMSVAIYSPPAATGGHWTVSTSLMHNDDRAPSGTLAVRANSREGSSGGGAYVGGGSNPAFVGFLLGSLVEKGEQCGRNLIRVLPYLAPPRPVPYIKEETPAGIARLEFEYNNPGVRWTWDDQVSYHMQLEAEDRYFDEMEELSEEIERGFADNDYAHERAAVNPASSSLKTLGVVEPAAVSVAEVPAPTEAIEPAATLAAEVPPSVLAWPKKPLPQPSEVKLESATIPKAESAQAMPESEPVAPAHVGVRESDKTPGFHAGVVVSPTQNTPSTSSPKEKSGSTKSHKSSTPNTAPDTITISRAQWKEIVALAAEQVNSNASGESPKKGTRRRKGKKEL